MNAQQNYRLLQEIDANRRFLLQAYRDNPELLARAEPGLRHLLEATRDTTHTAEPARRPASADFPARRAKKE